MYTGFLRLALILASFRSVCLTVLTIKSDWIPTLAAFQLSLYNGKIRFIFLPAVVNEWARSA